MSTILDKTRIRKLTEVCEIALSFVDAVNCKAPDTHPLYRQSANVSRKLQITLAKWGEKP